MTILSNIQALVVILAPIYGVAYCLYLDGKQNLL